MQARRIVDYRWDDLRVFLALYRHRTLASAGGKVGLDASTMSWRLAVLEEALGASLFDRSRDGVVPTSAAERLLPAAEEAERAAMAVLRVAEGFETSAEGVVRITAPPLLVDAFLGPCLPLVHERHPGVRLELLGSVSYADLTRREADIALRSKRAGSGDLVSVRGATSANGLFVSPTLDARLGVVRSWAEVPWATWTEDLAHLVSSAWLARYAADAIPVARSNSLGALVAAAQADFAAVITSEIVARRFGLVPLRHTEDLAASAADLPLEETWLIGHQALRNVPRIAAVWAFLLDELPRLAGTRPAA